MPRLNVYLPQDVFDLANRWRDSANLSEICARAIRDELDAVEGHRSARALFEGWRSPTVLETALARRYHLADVLVVDAPDDEREIREVLGRAAATYLNQNICDGSMFGITGGRQTWCIVRNLSPRRVRTTITALGLHQADPKLLHAHPNTLTTLLWLLYSPRSEAHVIGADSPSTLWAESLPLREYPNYFIVASCSSFNGDSPFGSLLGKNLVTSLCHRQVAGDFAYVFFNEAGEIVPVSLASPHSVVPAPTLRLLSKRSDARVLLVAGGNEKLAVVRSTLSAGLCNSIVTDTKTAHRLLADGGLGMEAPSARSVNARREDL